MSFDISDQFQDVALSECCQIISGSTPSRKESKYWDGDINWFTPKDLSGITSKYVSESPEKITQLGVNSCSTMLLPSRTLLLSSRAPIGHIAISTLEACTNQGFKSLFPNQNIDVEYLFYAIKNIVPRLQDLGNGATFKEISKATLGRVKIPLPPLAEQQKIAAILDAADSLRQKDQQLIEHYTSLSQSLFLEMFGDPVSNPMGWDIKPFDFFARIDTQMTTDFIKYADVPHIGIANIEKETGKLDNYNLVRDENLTSGKYVFTSEHIIYSKIRPNLNKVALPTFNGLSSADSYPILVNADNTNRLFFAYILRSPCFVDFILKHSSRTNIPKANKAQMRLFKGVAPPITLQNQFAETIQAIEAQKQQAQASLEKSEALFNSLLQRAFKGELTA